MLTVRFSLRPCPLLIWNDVSCAWNVACTAVNNPDWLPGSARNDCYYQLWCEQLFLGADGIKSEHNTFECHLLNKSRDCRDFMGFWIYVIGLENQPTFYNVGTNPASLLHGNRLLGRHLDIHRSRAILSHPMQSFLLAKVESRKTSINNQNKSDILTAIMSAESCPPEGKGPEGGWNKVTNCSWWAFKQSPIARNPRFPAATPKVNKAVSQCLMMALSCSSTGIG